MKVVVGRIAPLHGNQSSMSRIRFLMNFAGLPPTTVQGSTDLNTAADAPTTEYSPIFTPGPINALTATHECFPKTIGQEVRSCVGFEMSCVPGHIKASWDIVANSSSVTMFTLYILTLSSIHAPSFIVRSHGAQIRAEACTLADLSILAPNILKIDTRYLLNNLDANGRKKISQVIFHNKRPILLLIDK